MNQPLPDAMQPEAEEAAPVPPALAYPFARDHGLLLLLDDGADSPARVILRDGADPARLLDLRRIARRPLAIERVDAARFAALLGEAYAVDGALAADDMGLSEGLLDPLALGLPSAEDLLDTADDAPAIRLINGLIAEGVRRGVSDIHLEPYESGLVVRMREDGVLAETLRMPPHVAPVLVSRIKVMARLDIAERRLPQDGRIALTLGARAVDVRVSTLPSRAGERVVLRLLDKGKAGLTLADLGLDAATEAVLTRALAEPNGIVLVTGPTGSGKTTTLYAALRQLNGETVNAAHGGGGRNILTVEDPIEYAVDGVGQTQVNPRVGLTFAAGLRAILRQDPDVVMVGEIRDAETAQIAVQAALTGHLVLSTVHTNDATGAVTRLRDMGVEPFLLASCLRTVVAQRLVRRLCPACRTPVPNEKEGLERGAARALDIGRKAPIWAPAGCEACSGTGYQGRIGVFEALRVDDTVRKLVHESASEAKIARHAFADVPDLVSAARALVLAGETSASEALRIVRHGEGALTIAAEAAESPA